MKKLYTILKKKAAATVVLFMLAFTPTFAQTDVLVCGACSPQSWLDDVQTKLIATGSFNSVSTYNTYLTGTPTLAYLQTFDAVLVFTDYGAQDPTTLGNNLAAYIDGGGGVVNCVFSNASVLLGGNFNTTTYQVIVPANGQFSSPLLSLGSILIPCHPIIQGITSFDGGSSSYRSNSQTLAPGASFVANWSNGEWLVAQKINVGPMNVRRADLNFYPPSSDVRSDFWTSSTQGGQLMANALLWVAGITNPIGVPATPGAITGTSPICQNTTTNYSIAPVSGATSYTWVTPAGTTIQSGQGTTSITVLTGGTSGNITVTADNSCGSSPAATFSLTINPSPTVSSTSSPGSAVCPGGSVTLSGTGAVSYTWSGGIQDAVAFVPPSTTTYTVTGTDANGCTNTATHLVTVYALPTVVANATSTAVCDGSPVTLSGSGASTYTWTGSVTNNVAFVPTATDTYTVTGTDANGCMNTDAITVAVNTLPTIGSTSSPSPSAVCPGDSVTLNGTGAVSYTWTGGIQDAVAFVPPATTTYTVTGTDANGCMNTATHVVTVNPLPTVVANSTAPDVCPGFPVTLSGSGAVSYTWTSSVTDNVAFVPAATATYTVTGTDANGCMNSDAITVVVNPTPTIIGYTPVTTVCAGTSITLTGYGATSYTWTGGVFDGVPFTATTTTTYTVTGTDGNGCTNTDDITITVIPFPTVTGSSAATVMCIDDPNTILTGTPAGGFWTGAGAQASTFNPAIGGLGTDVVTYYYTDASGCEGSATVAITVNACTGVVESSLEDGVNVYPNPNTGEFTIAIDANVGDMKIEILDMQGRVVYVSHENNVQAGFTSHVSLKEMPVGIYVVRLTSAEEERMIKVSVQE